MFDFPVLLLFPAAMAFAGAMDLLTMTIPNRISLALIAGFVLAALLAGLSTHAILMHLAAGALILAIGIAMFAARLLGGGDAKLMAAASLWIGFDHLIPFFAMIAVLGGALAILLLAYRRVPAAALPGAEWVTRLHKSDSGMPYGLAIAGGGLWVYPSTDIFKALVS